MSFRLVHNFRRCFVIGRAGMKIWVESNRRCDIARSFGNVGNWVQDFTKITALILEKLTSGVFGVGHTCVVASVLQKQVSYSFGFNCLLRDKLVLFCQQ